jgi:hypothetical protein
MEKASRTWLLICVPAFLLWGYTLDYTQSEFSFYEENGYDRIKALKFALGGEPGTPELPAVYLNYIIPPSAKVESLFIIQSHLTQISGSYLIYPAQLPVVVGETVPWVPPDPGIYGSDALFPGEFIKIVDDGIFDGARVVTVAVYPLQYRPQTGMLFIVSEINFNFVFGQNTIPEVRAKIRGTCEQAVYDVAFRNIIENDFEIPAYYQKPAVLDENTFGTLAPVIPGAPGVIITDSLFFPAFQPYADWMTDQGIKTILISPEYIYMCCNGVDDAEKIRNYIEWCYTNAGGTYFILGGDDYFVPVRYGCTVNNPDTSTQYGRENFIPTDLYYSDLTGDWNTDGDNWWGEWEDNPDRYPEVFVGRVTPYVVAEVPNWVTKALHYEKTPGVLFNHVLWVTTVVGGYVTNGSAPLAFPMDFAHHYATDYWADAALNEIDQGYGFFNINCHGNIGDFTTKFTESGARIATVYSWRESSPNPSEAGLNWLTNVDKYSIGYSISCYCGAFDSLAHAIYYDEGSDTCIADAFVDAYQSDLSESPIGACAYLINTRNGYTGSSHALEYEFWDRIFKIEELPPSEPNISRVGVAEAMSKCAGSINWIYPIDRYVCYAHNLFGSPYFEAWTNTPGNMSVIHPTRIPVGEPTNFTVAVRDAHSGVPLPCAKVCLNKPNGLNEPHDIYEVGYTDAGGEVAFVITPQTTGTLKVTVTRLHNFSGSYAQYRPSQTTCRVRDYGGGGGQSFGSEDILPSTLCVTQMATILRTNNVITFGIPREGDITITLYDITGSRAKVIKRENLLPGYYQEKIDVTRLSSGIYFIVLRQANERVSRKCLLIK